MFFPLSGSYQLGGGRQLMSLTSFFQVHSEDCLRVYVYIKRPTKTNKTIIGYGESEAGVCVFLSTHEVNS